MKLYKWLRTNASAYTQPGDYTISYVISPMVHMITMLRPSLDDTFITFKKSENYYEKCIQKMIENGREPKIAFIFERQFVLIPISSKPGTVVFPPKDFDFKSSKDPISNYIKAHMAPIASFKISGDHTILCYLSKNMKPKNQHSRNQK